MRTYDTTRAKQIQPRVVQHFRPPRQATPEAFEHEADHAAATLDQSSALLRPETRAPVRQDVPGSVRRILSDTGRALETPLRKEMEQRLGHDFGRVRVHTGPAAEQSAQDVAANAYTIGNDIVFARGRYDSRSAEGRGLLAHELTHVAQQSGSHVEPLWQHANPAPIQKQPAAPQAGAKAAKSNAPAAAAPAAERKPFRADDSPAAKAMEHDSELSPVRQELLKLFGDFEKQVVGDIKFDSIKAQEAWDKLKADEKTAQAQYDTDKADYENKLASFKKGEIKKRPIPPIPVAKYTTCIDTQSKLLSSAFADAKVAAVTKRWDFGTVGQKRAEEIGQKTNRVVWHAGRMNMTERPKRGDVLVLSKRGEKVDKAAKDLYNIGADRDAKAAKSEAKEKAAKTAEDAVVAAREGLRALEDAQTAHTDKSYREAKSRVGAATTALALARSWATKAHEELEKSQARFEKLGPEYSNKLKKARMEVDHTKPAEFSHVGILGYIDPKKNADGTENWITFDGGQTVMSRGAKQGAESGRRTYDPVLNEITGEKSQGGEARWLQGWIDVDQLAQ
jgi:hypothetical protein